MAKNIFYTESTELLALAQKLRSRYYTVIGHVDLDKIFFAFKGGDALPEWFNCEVLGLKNEWVKHANSNSEETRTYCVAMTFDFYQKSDGPLLEWTLLDLLYNCDPKMNGKIRRRDMHEYKRIVSTLEDLGQSVDWRTNAHLPSLLGDETINFGIEEEEIQE